MTSQLCWKFTLALLMQIQISSKCQYPTDLICIPTTSLLILFRNVQLLIQLFCFSEKSPGTVIKPTSAWRAQLTGLINMWQWMAITCLTSFSGSSSCICYHALLLSSWMCCYSVRCAKHSNDVICYCRRRTKSPNARSCVIPTVRHWCWSSWWLSFSSSRFRWRWWRCCMSSPAYFRTFRSTTTSPTCWSCSQTFSSLSATPSTSLSTAACRGSSVKLSKSFSFVAPSQIAMVVRRDTRWWMGHARVPTKLCSKLIMIQKWKQFHLD